MTLTYGSLFSGVGGFDLGFDIAGYDCVFQVEWDKHCQQILARNWPDVPRWSDVQEVNGAEIPPCDVLTFGSPCQDLSVAGKRAGLDGHKSSMFFEATRIIKEMRHATGNLYPRIAVWENVPGALSSNRGADFRAVLDEMGDCGALEQEWAVLDAQHFGVPQRRRRIFLVAVFDPAIVGRCADQILPVGKGSRRNLAKGNKTRQDIATDAKTSPTIGFSHTQGLDAQPSQTAFPTLQSEGCGHAVMQPFVKVIRPASNQHPEVWRKEETAPTLNAFDNGGESRATVLFTAQRVGEAPRIYTETAPSLLSRMGTGGNNTPMVANNYAVRRLTPIECERLMGWPDNHTLWKADGTEQADSHRYKQCGNGVATPVAKWIAEQLKGIL